MSVADVLSGAATHHVACERAETFIDSLPDGCVSLLTLDFPYYGVKDDAWDNAWPTPEAFLEWMGGVLSQCRRVLAPNGSIYVFASPQMAWGVEGKVREHFAVLNRITWRKEEDRGKHAQTCKEALRSYFPNTEAIVFAEQKGNDTGDGSGYDIACDRIRGELFEPLRAYLDGERERAGARREDCNAALGFAPTPGGMASRHYFSRSQWWIPTRAHYENLRSYFNRNGGDFLSRSYDDVRAEYEQIDAAYQSAIRAVDCVRRPFFASKDIQYTDVWTYGTVAKYPGKHPCEKPEDMARDMVRASSRPGGLVADFFCGSGKFLAVAVDEGRRALGCDMDPHWAESAQRRCHAAKVTGRIARTAPAPKHAAQTSLFDIPPRT